MPSFETCQRIGCKYHKKESRYSIQFFEKRSLVIVKCLECKPNLEILRFQVARGEN
jgi:hypothetical protein